MFKDSLIGLNVHIMESKNKSDIGIEGIIIDDSRNMLTIKTSRGKKKVVKEKNKFLMVINNKEMLIDGKDLIGRVDERLKK